MRRSTLLTTFKHTITVSLTRVTVLCIQPLCFLAALYST